METNPIHGLSAAAPRPQPFPSSHAPHHTAVGVSLKITPAELAQVQREIYERACRTSGRSCV